MMKKNVTINESQLQKIIAESVKRCLAEGSKNGGKSEARKIAVSYAKYAAENGIELFDERGRATQGYYDIKDRMREEIYDTLGGNMRMSRDEYEELCDFANEVFSNAIKKRR